MDQGVRVWFFEQFLRLVRFFDNFLPGNFVFGCVFFGRFFFGLLFGRCQKIRCRGKIRQVFHLLRFLIVIEVCQHQDFDPVACILSQDRDGSQQTDDK